MRLIEFSHPGVQCKLSARSKKCGVAYEFDSGSLTSGTRFWNDENTHFRKFMKAKGKYLLNIENESLDAEVHEGNILFWGEFEPQSRFTKLDTSDNRLFPNAIHEPFLNERNQGFHNTDPYVFGEHFYYSNCKQHIRNMTSLKVGSLILFGTEYSEGFALDTVFVVGKRISAMEYLESKNQYSHVLRKATLDKNSLYNENTKLTLYEGKMLESDDYWEDSSNIFCFFPCKPFDKESSLGFQRPLLNYATFGLQSPGAGTVLYDLISNPVEDQIIEYWRKVVAEVVSQGYSIGVYADEPNYVVNEQAGRVEAFSINDCGAQTKKSETPSKACR